MNIINGYRNNPHITSQQLRNTYIPIFGKDACILDVGSKMAVTVISANEVEIADGQLICEGCTAEIAHGTTESLTIENGTQGEQRIDLIVARYTKNAGTGVEDMQLAVVKGTPAATNPAVPSYNDGTIADGDSPVDFPLYAVHLDGISITLVERLVDVVSIKGTTDALGTRMTAAESAIATLNTKTTRTSGPIQQYTDGVSVELAETTASRSGDFVELKLRFTVVSSAALSANKTLFMLAHDYCPASVFRPIVHDWNLGQPRRFNIFPNGAVQTTDPLPTGLSFIMTFVYMGVAL